ncbi:hypothetical protein BJ166DRAFT_84492 [Pestalotiopsis sp. NC0098]|nr:hypothetical protein BJ166DRAFT_84492 [Pestalotiopsis sp. NC0098]
MLNPARLANCLFRGSTYLRLASCSTLPHCAKAAATSLPPPQQQFLGRSECSDARARLPPAKKSERERCTCLLSMTRRHTTGQVLLKLYWPPVPDSCCLIQYTVGGVVFNQGAVFLILPSPNEHSAREQGMSVTKLQLTNLVISTVEMVAPGRVVLYDASYLEGVL